VSGISRSSYSQNRDEANDDHDPELEAILLQRKTKYGFLQKISSLIFSQCLKSNA
jgi:hypothetical protein